MDEKNKEWLNVLNEFVKDYPDLDVVWECQTAYNGEEDYYNLQSIQKVSLSDYWEIKNDDCAVKFDYNIYTCYDDVKDNILSCDYSIDKKDVDRIIAENYKHTKIILVTLG